MSGGKRPGAGRRKGIPNKASAARELEAQATGLTPCDVMLDAMRQLWVLAQKNKNNRKLNEHYVVQLSPSQRIWLLTFTLGFRPPCHRTHHSKKRIWWSKSSVGCQLGRPRKDPKGRNTATCRRRSRAEYSASEHHNRHCSWNRRSLDRARLQRRGFVEQPSAARPAMSVNPCAISTEGR
jgi:hypothetical protein